MNQQVLQQNLTNLRNQKALTQKQLAEELNYSDKVISKWERGESIPNAEVLSELATYYSISIDTLIGRVDSKNSLKNEIIRLETIKTESPSIWELMFIVPFATFAGVSLISFRELFGISFFLLGLSIIVYSFILAKSTFETQYQDYKIRVKNRAFKLSIYIDDELVLIDKSVFKVNPIRRVVYKDIPFTFEFKNMTSLKCNIFVLETVPSN